MDVVFTRTGSRRYRVAVRRAGSVPELAMEPAPGYHDHLPHDLVHLAVERHFGLRDGIYGQLAAGGDAGTFRPVGVPRTRRMARALARGNTGGTEVGRSERLAALCFGHWLARRGERHDPAAVTPGRRAESGVDERSLDAVLDRMDALAARWHALPVGGSLTVPWPDR